jgi:predicted phosphate transport protein (TIGR00153 family)
VSLISSLFGHSPVRPLQRHMKVAVSCAREVRPLVAAMAEGDREAMSRHREEIVRLEHEADEIKNQLRAHLPKHLFMAIERRDMLEILDNQDSIADRAQDIAELADMRGMVAPAPLGGAIIELCEASITACEKAEEVINELNQLVETGFGPRESARVETMIAEVGKIESETDRLAEVAQRALFEIEDELGIGTYFWYKLIGWIGNMADHAEKVGNRLRLLIAN